MNLPAKAIDFSLPTLSLVDTIARVLDAFQILPYARISLADALGRVLAEDVSSAAILPSQNLAAEDGYAVHLQDVSNFPVTLSIIAESLAAAPYTERFGRGATVMVAKGAPVPEGTDAVIRDHEGERTGNKVTFRTSALHGQNIRAIGLDFSPGEICIKAGTIVTARTIGLAAAMNVPWLTVRHPPEIAVAAIGNELVLPGESKDPKHTYASTNLAICAFVKALGGNARNLGVIGDSEKEIGRMLKGAKGADLLISTGGLSGPARRSFFPMLEKHGATLDCWRADIGVPRPLVFGDYKDTPFMGFPGNPISAMLLAYLVLKPVLEHMLGMTRDKRRWYATLGRNLDVNDIALNYLRAVYSFNAEGKLIVTPVSSQDSFLISSLVAADCLVLVDHAKTRAGEIVEIIPLNHSVLST